jgi:Zn-dependent protease
MIYSLDLLVACLCAVALGYVIFVNRRRQYYMGRFVLDVPVEEAWELFSTRPGFPSSWVPGLVSTEWRNESTGDVVCRFKSGNALFLRLITQEAPYREESISVHSRAGAARLGDTVLARLSLRPVEEGTEVELTFVIERRHLTPGFLGRLGYPMVVRKIAGLVRAHLARSRQDRHGPVESRTRRIEEPVSEPVKQLVLAALSLLALSHMFGLEAGLAVLVTIVVHEYGHVVALRRHGQRARFYLIPFFGGVAMGDRPYESDAEACEVFLMGPAFGLLPPLGCFGLFAALGDYIWLQVGFVALMVNLFNLLPIPPLDGGRVTQVFLKLFGDAVWFTVSGLLILAGGALAFSMKAPEFLVLLIFAATALNASPRRSFGDVPLSLPQGLTAGGAYLALVALHAGAAIWCNSYFNINLLRWLF